MVNNNIASATKPCQNCGTPIAVGIVACSQCQREWMLQFKLTHSHLFDDKRKAA